MLQRSRDDEADLARLADSHGSLLRTRLASFFDTRTPRELQALLHRFDALPYEACSRAGVRPVLDLLRREQAQPFHRHVVSSDAEFYSDPDVPTDRKFLLMTFAGSGNRLMMPTSLFLQHLPANQFDVVCLKDRQNASYEAGLDGFRGPLPATVLGVAAAVGARRYRGLYCYGTSMGGFPALRAGRSLRAKRAISVGGTFSWPINRLLERPTMNIQAFESLCSCAPASPTELLCAFSGGFARDVKNAQLLRKMMPVRFFRHNGSDQHNLAYWMIHEGIFGRFLGMCLDFDPNLLHRPLPH